MGELDEVALIPRRYRNCTELGRGGMGVVYRAYDTRMDRNVAIKILTEENFADDVSRSLFRNEARAIATLNHPNIAIAHDLERGDKTDVLVLELIEGRSLDAVVRERKLTEAEVLAIAAQVADGLAYAHSRDVIHRDLKPGNLMLKPDGHVKILDFGLAKRLKRPVSTTSSSGPMIDATEVFLGTLSYVPPEQIRGGNVEAPADVYAFGATLFHLATGRPPFDDEDMTHLVAAVLERTPPSASAINPKVSRELDALLGRMLAKEPALRPKAQDLVREIAAMRDTSGRKESRPLMRAALFAAFSAATMGAGAVVADRIVTSAPPVALAKQIEVVTTPAGAHVYVNGEPLGAQAPVTLSNLPQGSVQIAAYKDGFEPAEQRIELPSSKTQRVDLVLQKRGRR